MISDTTSHTDRSDLRAYYERMAATALDWLMADTDRESDPDSYEKFDAARDLLEAP